MAISAGAQELLVPEEPEVESVLESRAAVDPAASDFKVDPVDVSAKENKLAYADIKAKIKTQGNLKDVTPGEITIKKVEEGSNTIADGGVTKSGTHKVTIDVAAKTDVNAAKTGLVLEFSVTAAPAVTTLALAIDYEKEEITLGSATVLTDSEATVSIQIAGGASKWFPINATKKVTLAQLEGTGNPTKGGTGNGFYIVKVRLTKAKKNYDIKDEFVTQLKARPAAPVAEDITFSYVTENVVHKTAANIVNYQASYDKKKWVDGSKIGETSNYQLPIEPQTKEKSLFVRAIAVKTTGSEAFASSALEIKVKAREVKPTAKDLQDLATYFVTGNSDTYDKVTQYKINLKKEGYEVRVKRAKKDADSTDKKFEWKTIGADVNIVDGLKDKGEAVEASAVVYGFDGSANIVFEVRKAGKSTSADSDAVAAGVSATLTIKKLGGAPAKAKFDGGEYIFSGVDENMQYILLEDTVKKPTDVPLISAGAEATDIKWVDIPKGDIKNIDDKTKLGTYTITKPAADAKKMNVWIRYKARAVTPAKETNDKTAYFSAAKKIGTYEPRRAADDAKLKDLVFDAATGMIGTKGTKKFTPINANYEFSINTTPTYFMKPGASANFYSLLAATAEESKVDVYVRLVKKGATPASEPLKITVMIPKSGS